MGTTQPIRSKSELLAFRMYYRDIKPNMRNYCLIVMGLNTALRISDLLELKWTDVYNFEHKEFRTHFLINEQKTGKNNYVTLNSNATSALFHILKKEILKMTNTFFPKEHAETSHLTGRRLTES